jgi:hypothetical protein
LVGNGGLWSGEKILEFLIEKWYQCSTSSEG